VLNAIEAISAPGNIYIRVRHGHDGQGRAGIRVTVADDGCGIPAENMPQIFEPFFSTKDSKGTGLGLWVSQGIVQKHQGSLRVRSRTDETRHGTCCGVFLPFATNEAAAEDAPLASGDQEQDVMTRSAGSGNDRSAA
jgi:signal transduction histidine kinase